MQNQINAESSAAYWNEHGALWDVLYKERPKALFYYRAQELLIHSIIIAAQPSSIFEYGCGPGRIARLLKSYFGVEVFVADQSSTMLEQLKRWADPDWAEKHVFQVDGLCPELPESLIGVDVAFTNEVLIHNDSTQLQLILSEFEKLEPTLVFHVEPLSGEILESSDHFGCFAHDIEGYYNSRGWNTIVFRNVCGQQSLVIGSKKDLSTISSKIAPIADYVRELTKEVQKNYDRLQIIERKVVDPVGENVELQLESELKKVRGELAFERSRLGFHLTQAHRSHINILQLREVELTDLRSHVKSLEAESRVAAWEIEDRRRQMELLSQWRPFRLASKIRNLVWRTKSLLTSGRDRLVLTALNDTPVPVSRILINGGNLVPEFIYRTSESARVDRPPLGSGVILRDGAIAVDGAKSWRVEFGSLPDDAKITLTWNRRHWDLDAGSVNAQGGIVEVGHLMKKDQ